MTLPVREFRKSVTHISRSYGQEFSVLFFDSRCTYNSLPDISYESTGEPSLFNTWRESIAASELSHDACRRRQLSPLSCHFLLNEIKPYRNKRGRNKGTVQYCNICQSRNDTFLVKRFYRATLCHRGTSCG